MKTGIRCLFCALALFTGTRHTAAQCTVNWNDPHQTIDGFGASSAWTASNLSDAQADLFFSSKQGVGYTSIDGTSSYTFNGIGLSLLRNRIHPGDDTYSGNGDDTQMVTDDLITMQKAQARGARIWSSPWTPPKALKDNNAFCGGHFAGTPANYQTYASELANYVVNLKNNGINLYAISIQNEPDYDPTANGNCYDSCLWTVNQNPNVDEIHDFVPYLFNALAAKNVSATKIMLPESENWPDPRGLATGTLNDPATAVEVGIIANHNYVPDNNAGDQIMPATVNNHGKQLWETEVSTSSPFDRNIDINNAIYWATRIHLFLTTPGVEANAWHYWWLLPYTDNVNGALTDTNGVPAKRLFVLGNFSRFIRPGYIRFGATGNTGGALVSAYQGPDGNFVIVAINPTGADIANQVFNVPSFSGWKPDKFRPLMLVKVTFVPDSVTPWTTAGNDINVNSLASGNPIAINNSSFSYTLPAMSVVTFDGQSGTVENLPPWWRWIIIRWWWWLISISLLIIAHQFIVRKIPPPPPPPEKNPAAQP